MKILIVDDDEAIASIWETAFKKEGAETLVASTAKAGIEEAKKQKFDFILLDEIMPDMKGNDLLKVLKSDPQLKNVPVALVSNYSDNKLMQEAIQQGATDYILKYQIEPMDLVNKVKSLLQETQNSGNTNQ